MIITLLFCQLAVLLPNCCASTESPELESQTMHNSVARSAQQSTPTAAEQSATAANVVQKLTPSANSSSLITCIDDIRGEAAFRSWLQVGRTERFYYAYDSTAATTEELTWLIEKLASLGLKPLNPESNFASHATIQQKALEEKSLFLCFVLSSQGLVALHETFTLYVPGGYHLCPSFIQNKHTRARVPSLCVIVEPQTINKTLLRFYLSPSGQKYRASINSQTPEEFRQWLSLDEKTHLFCAYDPMISPQEASQLKGLKKKLNELGAQPLAQEPHTPQTTLSFLNSLEDNANKAPKDFVCLVLSTRSMDRVMHNCSLFPGYYACHFTINSETQQQSEVHALCLVIEPKQLEQKSKRLIRLSLKSDGKPRTVKIESQSAQEFREWLLLDEKARLFCAYDPTLTPNDTKQLEWCLSKLQSLGANLLSSEPSPTHTHNFACLDNCLNAAKAAPGDFVCFILSSKPPQSLATTFNISCPSYHIGTFCALHPTRPHKNASALCFIIESRATGFKSAVAESNDRNFASTIL